MNNKAENQRLVIIGSIVNVHGLAGGVKVRSHAESIDTFKSADTVILKYKNGERKKLAVKRITGNTNPFILFFDGINSREHADSLRGCDVFVEEDSLKQPDEGEYYWFAVIGLDVFTVREEYLGKVKEIIPTGANDVYVVKNKNKETLIPALESVVSDIDIEKNMMRVDLPEGL